MDSPYQSYALWLLARIRQLRNDGLKYKEVAALMGLEGYRTLRGRALNPNNLRVLVHYAQHGHIKRLRETAARSGILGLKLKPATEAQF